MYESNQERERLVAQLNDPQKRAAYKKLHDRYQPSFLPSILGRFFIASGNLFYGRAPSYLKFRAIEVIARVPYHSWESAAYTLMSLFYWDEHRAVRLLYRSSFAHMAADNETMHVVVVSQLVKRERRGSFIRHTLIPLIFAFFYFWVSYGMYLFSPRHSLELNYLFENHAFEQYDQFVADREEELRRKPMDSEFLKRYGRHVDNQLEFFRSVRNDELIHRNSSIEEISTISAS